MLVNYFCGVDDRLKSLARQTQVFARQAQITGPAGTKRWPGRLKSLARQAQSAPLHRASRQPFCTHLLVLQVPNILWLVIERDRLNLGVV